MYRGIYTYTVQSIYWSTDIRLTCCLKLKQSNTKSQKNNFSKTFFTTIPVPRRKESNQMNRQCSPAWLRLPGKQLWATIPQDQPQQIDWIILAKPDGMENGLNVLSCITLPFHSCVVMNNCLVFCFVFLVFKSKSISVLWKKNNFWSSGNKKKTFWCLPTLKTSEKNPEPIHSQVKSSRRVRQEKALIRAL